MPRRKATEEEEQKPKPPLGSPERPHFREVAPTKENPAGVEQVDPEHAKALGNFRGAGGPGAAGATVLGGVGFAATEGGSKPLPTDKDGEMENAHSGSQPASEGARPGENIGALDEGAESATQTGETHPAETESSQVEEPAGNEE